MLSMARSRMSQARDKMDKCGMVRRASCFIVLAFVFVFCWFQVFFFNFLTVPAPRMGIPFFSSSRQGALRSTSSEGFRIEVTSFNEHLWKPLKIFEENDDPCAGRYVYMYQLPRELNEGILDDCKRLSVWTDMCKFTSNLGMGPPLVDDSEGSFSDKGWYATNQFAVEVIFHNRMKKYDCLTNDSSKAAAVFVPYYAGLDVARYLWGYNTSARDAGAEGTIRWLKRQPEWKRMGGRDHFMVAGRITWDFRRKTEKQEDWGNKLFMIPEAKNITSLVIEASPWHYNDFAIPYPTYFHPTCDWDIMAWQDRMRKVDRPWLFSFAGAPRQLRKSIRGQIMEQCRESQHCNLLECDFGESKCHVPSVVMKLFEGSVFCLQPQGDSFTRRSIFDSMLAGCIPVFFHPDSAYSQFVWHLPRDYRKYSVFISEIDIRRNNLTIESRLLQIPSQQVARLREQVIRLIPGLLYADPGHHLETMKDAFDVAVDAVIDKNAKLRARLLQGHKDEELAKLHKKEGEELDEVLGNEDAIRRWQAQVQQEETSN